MGIKSRRKGKVGEREFAALLRSNGYEAERGVQHRGGPGSPDVCHSMRLIHFEVKRARTVSLHDALRQAASDAPVGHLPVVAHRADRRGWVAIMDFDTFLKLYETGGW